MDATLGPGFEGFSAAPVMAAAGPVARRALWRQSATRRYRAGEIIRLQGDPADHLLVLLSGSVAASYLTAAGSTVALEDFTTPRAIDKIAVIDGGGHTATLTAMGQCTIAAVPRRLFLATIDDLPAARAHVFQALAAHARAQQARLVLASTPGGRHRVAWWLAGQLSGRLDSRQPQLVRLPGSQSRLAQLLGVTRVTVNRALKELEREGTIRTAPGGIEVLDPGRLSGHLRA